MAKAWRDTVHKPLQRLLEKSTCNSPIMQAGAKYCTSHLEMADNLFFNDFSARQTDVKKLQFRNGGFILF